MTKNNEDVIVGGFGIDSKFMRITLMIASMFLIFIGPTYIPYLMVAILKIDYIASITVGLALFIVGIMLMLFLIRKKVIT